MMEGGGGCLAHSHTPLLLPPQRTLRGNKVLEEIRVDYTRCLWRGQVELDGPRAHLVRARCEEVRQPQRRIARLDNAWHGRLDTAEALAIFLALLGLHVKDLCFELDGEGDDAVILTQGLDPVREGHEVLVVLAHVVLLGEVHELVEG